MGYGLQFDPVNKILLGRFRGELTGESAAEFYEAFRRFTIATNASAGIVDFSSATDGALASESSRDQSTSQAPALVDAAKRPRIIVGTTAGFDLMCMSQIVGGPPQSLLQVVHTMDEALAALGVQSASFCGPTATLRPEVLNLNAVVSDILKIAKRLIDEDIEVRTLFDPTLAPVKEDPGQIEQVMMNLVVNAREAMPNGGQLSIETTNVASGENHSPNCVTIPPGRYVMLSVSDTGVGMDTETQSHIFDPFFTTKEKGKGTGLGLTSVYGIVKQAGGYIEVASERGKGTTFKVYLRREDAGTYRFSFGAIRCDVATGTVPTRR